MFIATMNQLQEVKNKWLRGELNPWQYSRERERLLRVALTAMAEEMGVKLKPVGNINVNGEVLISAATAEENPKYPATCGQFGEQFARMLNACNPRCGVTPGAIMHAASGWCYIHHFMIERMVMRHYAEVMAEPLAA